MSSSAIIDTEALASLYPAHVETVKARHDRALERAGASHCIIYSGAPLPVFLDDYNYPFKPNPHFVCWAPLNELPHSYLIYTPGEKPVIVYFQEKDYWHTPPQDPTGFWTASFDIRLVHTREEIAQHLPADREKCIFVGQLQADGESFGVERVNPSSVMNMLHYDRAVKTDYEIECMRQASRRAVAGHLAAEAAFRDGCAEFDIHLAYCRAVDHSEYELPYGNIVALNENGAVLHYQHLARRAPARTRSFLIDAGAQVYGYASDITRTYAFQQDEFAELIDDFDRLQLGLVNEIHAGVNYAELHLLAHERIAGFLVRHGLATGSPEALIEAGVTSAFFPHGLGHLLGAQVHDVGGLMADDSGSINDRPSGHPFLRLTRDLEAGMVLTIEPGMYVIDLLLENLSGAPAAAMINESAIARIRPYGGIRIEDDVVVTETGCENLTRDAFSAVA